MQMHDAKIKVNVGVDVTEGRPSYKKSHFVVSRPTRWSLSLACTYFS